MNVNEEQIYDQHSSSKPKLLDVGIRHTRNDAKILAGGWKHPSVTVKIHHRYIKADGVDYPVFLIVSRLKE